MSFSYFPLVEVVVGPQGGASDFDGQRACMLVLPSLVGTRE